MGEFIYVFYSYPYKRYHITDYYKRLGISPRSVVFCTLHSIHGLRNKTLNVFGELEPETAYILKEIASRSACKIVNKSID